MDHDGCRRAVRRGYDWRCCGCNARLAERIPHDDLPDFRALTIADLRQMARTHGELPSYGLAQRTLVRGKERHGGNQGLGAAAGILVAVPLFAYCTVPGCGIGQHIE